MVCVSSPVGYGGEIVSGYRRDAFFIAFDPFRTSSPDMIEFEEEKGYKRVIE